MDFRDTGMTTDTIERSDAPTTTGAPTNDRHEVRARPFPVEVDHGRDALLTDFGKDTLKDRYLLPGESYQDLFVRVASAYADDAQHAQRLHLHVVHRVEVGEAVVD